MMADQAVSSTAPTTGLIDAVRLLHQVRARRRVNAWSVQGLRSAKRMLLIGTIVIPGSLFLVLGFTLVMAIKFGESPSQEQAEMLLASLLLVSFATALAGSLSTAMQSLFASDDVRFLVSLPIPVRAIFFDRLGEIARGAAPGVGFGLASCLAYVLGRAEDYRFVFFGLMSVMLLCATAVTMGASTTAITVRYAKPSHSQRILLFLSMALIFGTALIWRASNTYEESQSHMILDPVLAFSPAGWARSALVRSVGSEPQSAIPFVLLQLAALVGLTIVGARVFASTYTSNIERTEIASIRTVTRRSSPVGRRILRLVPRTSVHWVKREWLLLSRDFSRMSAAILPVGSVAVWITLSFIWGNPAGNPQGDQFWLAHSPVLLLPWGISLGSTVFAIGSEGRGFELIRVLPISASGLMRAKYFAYMVPILLICVSVAFLSAIIKPGSSTNTWQLVLQTAVLTVLVCVIDISFASISPRFDRGHAQRSTGIFARITSAGIGLALSGLVIFAMSNTPLGDPDLLPVLGGSSANQSAAVAAVAFVLAILLPALLLRSGRKRLNRSLASR
jgi:uncharacterized membrane protein (DUF485 family)